MLLLLIFVPLLSQFPSYIINAERNTCRPLSVLSPWCHTESQLEFILGLYSILNLEINGPV
jgi:hypothetical protein